ncbi:ATP-binding protein [Promicromonospora sukumoe]|uniref:ATP-binding protein n=1 Tax=Promicromonospora sukumoe TaxID=88382 RepID=UPI0037C55C0F
MAARNEDEENLSDTGNLAFTVDTHLLRELGALLVGRDSTALVELIKNAYDADATRVTVHGESLQAHGTISVNDDGHGMTYDDFTEKFLRIAGRSKESGPRRSPRYARKFTGAKGIGRLSSHKLGERLTLESSPDPSVLNRTAHPNGFRALIDWPQIENSTKSIDATRLIRATPTAGSGEFGTLLSVGSLYSGWSARQLNNFLAEVRSTRPDSALIAPFPARMFAGQALLPQIEIADTGPEDPGFEIEMSGEFAGTESQWPTLLSQAGWAIEIDARGHTEVKYRVTPSIRTVREFPEAQQRDFSWRRPSAEPRFVARIFVRDPNADRALKDVLTKFAKEASGVRVFFEGFRVLPYGTPRNDWLGIDREYTVRRSVDLLGVSGAGIEPPSEADERTYRLPNGSYFGGVFLRDAESGGLQMVVNREGFLPGDSFDQITDIISRAINIVTRMRAALGAQRRLLERERVANDLVVGPVSPSDRGAGSLGPTQTRPEAIRNLIEAGRESASALRQTPVLQEESLRVHLATVERVLGAVEAESDAASDEQAQLRVLAGLGTQLGAFVHEVNGVLGQANTISDALDRLIDICQAPDVPGDVAKRLRSIRRAQSELVGALDRQAVYLSDSLGAEARRRRSRQKISERWSTATRLLGNAATRRGIELTSAIPPELRSPPMFAAELNVILTNLLSNAIKAASRGGESGRVVRASASKEAGRIVVRVENTGDAVKIEDGERWFKPFETTTSEVDEALGQGLGLGLPLTRRIIEEYGGEIYFAEPDPAMATCVEFWLPSN